MKEMRFIRKEVAPSMITINGNQYPITYTFETAGMIEEAFGEPLQAVIGRFFGTEKDESGNRVQMERSQQMKLLACMMQSAGVQVEAEDLTASIHMSEGPEIAKAMLKEMMSKMPAPSEKRGNGRAAQMKTGGSTGTGASTPQ